MEAWVVQEDPTPRQDTCRICSLVSFVLLDMLAFNNRQWDVEYGAACNWCVQPCSVPRAGAGGL
jgi:hypothetical protein